MEPEICTKIFKNFSERFPATTLSDFMVKIGRLEDALILSYF